MQLSVIMRLAALSIFTLALTGCIPDIAYHPIGNKQPIYAAPRIDDDHAFGNNVAIVELHGSGYLHPCCGNDQLNFTERLIQSARNGAPDKSRVEVIAFIHGNQNNARDDSDNYGHFLQLIDCLNSGTDSYKRHFDAFMQKTDQATQMLRNTFERSEKDPFECSKPLPAPGVRYIGVYIGWRGSLNTRRWDFQQREARRVADGNDILEILRRIRDAAKPVGADPSRLLVFGHSFGGLILERAIYHLYQGRPSGAGSVQPFADAVITVNEATGGLLAKRLIERTNGYSVAGLTPGNEAMPARPLLITMHSKSDPLTGSFATWGRRILGPPSVPRTVNPDDDKHFAEPDYTESGDKPPIWKVRRSNPSNLLFFDNACYIGDEERKAAAAAVKSNSTYITGDHSITGDGPGCDDVANALVIDNAQQDRLRLFHMGGAFPQLENLYRRIEYRCRGTEEPQYKRNDNRDLCITSQSIPWHDFDLEPWNRSADWMINIPDNIISGHGGYWAPGAIELFLELTNVWPVLSRKDSLP